MLINPHSLVLIMGSLQFFLTLRKLTIEKQTVVSTKRDLPQFVVGNINKTRGQNGNQGQPKLIMQTCTSGLRPRHRFVRCLRSLMINAAARNLVNPGCTFGPERVQMPILLKVFRYPKTFQGFVQMSIFYIINMENAGIYKERQITANNDRLPVSLAVSCMQHCGADRILLPYQGLTQAISYFCPSLSYVCIYTPTYC